MYIFLSNIFDKFFFERKKTNKMFSYTNYIRAVEQTYREIIWLDISLFSEVNKFDVTAETFSIRENVFTLPGRERIAIKLPSPILKNLHTVTFACKRTRAQ